MKKINVAFLVVNVLLLIIIKYKGCEEMVDMYTKLVEVGRRKIDSIPAKYKALVIENLIAMGLNENGDIV